LVIVIAVQTFYAMVVRPTAEAIRSADLARMAKDPNYVPELKPWVIVKDPEQETCFIFTLWALTIMGFKAVRVERGQRLLKEDLLHLPEGMKILPEDRRGYARQIEGRREGIACRRTRGSTRGRSRRCLRTYARSCCLAR